MPKTTPKKTEDGFIDTALLEHQHFDDLIGALFTAKTEDVSVKLKLVSCDVHPKGTPPGAKREAFSLIFEGQTRDVLLNGDGSYALENPELGQIRAALVSPIITPPNAKGQLYQLCFN